MLDELCEPDVGNPAHIPSEMIIKLRHQHQNSREMPPVRDVVSANSSCESGPYSHLDGSCRCSRSSVQYTKPSPRSSTLVLRRYGSCLANQVQFCPHSVSERAALARLGSSRLQDRKDRCGHSSRGGGQAKIVSVISSFSTLPLTLLQS